MGILKEIIQDIFSVKNSYIGGFKYKIVKILGFKCSKSLGYKPEGKNNNIYVVENSVKKSCKKRITGLGIKIKGNNNEIIVNSPYKFNNCSVTIEGNNSVIILGESITLNNTSLYAVNNAQINIGKNTTTNGGRISCISKNSKINIGEDCMFSWDIHIMSGDHHIMTPLENNKIINKGHFCNIGNHVWLGCGATICKNVEIADNCIVGTKSVVTKSCYEKNTVLAGNPARIMKRNVNWVRENDN